MPKIVSDPKIVTFATRVSERTADRIDAALDGRTRSAWIADAIDTILGPDHESKPRRQASSSGPEPIAVTLPPIPPDDSDIEEGSEFDGPTPVKIAKGIACKHPKSKLTIHPWGTVCECGKKIR